MLVLYYTAEVNKFAHYFSEIITLQIYIGICSDLGGFATCFVDEVKSCMCHFLVGEHTGWQKKLNQRLAKRDVLFVNEIFALFLTSNLRKHPVHIVPTLEREREIEEKSERAILIFLVMLPSPFRTIFVSAPKVYVRWTLDISTRRFSGQVSVS